MSDITCMFTLDTKHCYIVNNGVLEREEMTRPIAYYADSGPNVGYLRDGDVSKALMIKDNVITRISKDDFFYLKQQGMVCPSDTPGVIKITAPRDLFGKISTYSEYKMGDREGDFDNVSVPTPKSEQNFEPVENNIDPHVPDLVQDLGMRFIGRQVTEKEIQVYKQIIEAIDNKNGDALVADFNPYMDIIKKMHAEGTILYEIIGSYITFAVKATDTYHFMKRAVELYDASHIVSGGKTPPPLSVAAAAMNLSKTERERIGLINQGGYQNTSRPTGQSRFGSEGVTTGSIHRPRSLGSTAVFPFDVPCVVRKTAPYYTMMAMKKPFIEFAKPIESFLTAKITIDKRIPMRVVPMVTNDRYGYAFPKRMLTNEKIVSDKCTPVATRVPGVYWMFYEMRRSQPVDNQEFQFIPDALVEYIDSKSASFDLSKSGIVTGMASSLGTAAGEALYGASNKEEVLKIYAKFFEETGKGLFRPMKVSYNSGFVIALTRSATQVLLTSVVLNSTIDYSMYPEHITVIPLEDKYGLLVIGAEPADIAEVERVLSGAETIDDEGEFDQPED